MEVIEERGFIDKADAVTKAETWLRNESRGPHEVTARRVDNLAGEGSDTNNAGRT